MDPIGGEPFLDQNLRQPVGPVLGAGKDQGLVDFPSLEQLHQQGGFPLLNHRVYSLGDADRGGGLPLNVDRHRVVENFAGELGDFCGHGGAEKQILPLLRDMPEHSSNVREETHVEHPVRLVEDQVLDPSEFGVGLSEMIEEPTRRGHDHVHPAPESMLLRPHPDAAKDRRPGDRGVRCQGVEVLNDLSCQLPGGRDDQGPSGSPGPVD